VFTNQLFLITGVVYQRFFIACVSTSLFDVSSRASCCYASACSSLTFLVCVHMYHILSLHWFQIAQCTQTFSVTTCIAFRTSESHYFIENNKLSVDITLFHSYSTTCFGSFDPSSGDPKKIVRFR
jgi:hypothetical protein